MSTVFIVEDDVKIRELLQSHIERYGYRVVSAVQFDDILDQFNKIQPDIVIMDVNLPRFDGYYWCLQIRSISTCPILFLSAREETMDQVMALEYGADDYVTKPFYYEVVMAKIKGLLRRAYGSYSTTQGERVVKVDDLVLYPERMELELDQKRIELSKKEMLLLELLMLSPQRVIGREDLLATLWDNSLFVDDNTLNVYITRVRKKLKELGIKYAIETVRGAGYRLIFVPGDAE